jgi:SAM-dependent methyltransferase
MTEGLYVQYGCGFHAPEGWLNFDSSPTLRVERLPLIGKYVSTILKRNAQPFLANVRYGDIVKGLPLTMASCNAVYCSHVLEHLSLDDLRKALINTRALLKPGGIFRLVVPDLEYYVRRYSENDSPDAALDFMRATGLGETSRGRGIRGRAQELLGNSRHRWMWDYPSLEMELIQLGFRRVRRANMGDSADPMFNRVERSERWTNCLGIECIVR